LFDRREKNSSIHQVHNPRRDISETKVNMRPIILLTGLALIIAIVTSTINAKALANADADADAEADATAEAFAGILDDAFDTLGTVVYKI